MNATNGGRPLVSVCMPVLNPHPVYFREAVASVLAQTLAHWELVIVEDPSASSAAALLEGVNDPRVRLYTNAERTSLVAQRNQTLTLARAELVALLDADDVCEPDWLAKQVAYLREHPDVDVLGCQLTLIDHESSPFAVRDYPQRHEELVAAMRRYNPLAQPGVMLKKHVASEAGGYQYARYLFTEDYELWCRLAARGARFANHPERLVRYRMQPGQGKSRRLRDILRGTIEIKQTYFRGRLGVRGRLRLWGERCLLLLPPSVVLKLFGWTQLRWQRRTGSCR